MKTGRRPWPRRSRDAGGREAATATFAGRDQGTESGCSGRDSLGLQPRIPATSFPKGHLSWPLAVASTSPSDLYGIPACELGYPLLLVTTVSSIQTLSLLEAWPKTIPTFHFQHSFRRGGSFCPCGVPEFEVMPTHHTLESNDVGSQAVHFRTQAIDIQYEPVFVIAVIFLSEIVSLHNF